MSSSATSELLEGQARKDAVDRLLAVLNDPLAEPEALLDAQEKLDWFAREIVEWFRPTGFRLLVYVPYLQEKMENGLLMTAESRAMYQSAGIYGTVLAMGPQAYTGERFPNGPYCQVGDRVMFRAYSGSRFERTGYPFLYVLLNDDAVEGVISDEINVERPRR